LRRARKSWSLSGVFEVEVRNVAGEPAAIGNAGPFTVVVDRPADGGGRGIGFNGGQLLYLAIAGCVSNDLFREARADGVDLTSVRVVVRGDFAGDPPVSTDVVYDVEVSGNASRDELLALVGKVDEIAEIPNSLRRGTSVKLASADVR
jgi:putative redox protein